MPLLKEHIATPGPDEYSKDAGSSQGHNTHTHLLCVQAGHLVSSFLGEDDGEYSM